MNEDQIIADYLPLVKSIAAKYHGLPFEDLVQEGCIGLIDAARSFDPSRGTQFSTFAWYHIRKRILSALQTNEILELHPDEEKIPDPSEGQAEDTPKRLNLPEDMPDTEELILRYSFEDKLSLKQISRIMGMRVERVRYIKAKAMRRMKITLIQDTHRESSQPSQLPYHST